jgi:hypothetical protein
MKDRMGLTGEASNHKLAGVFDDEVSALELAAAVRARTGLNESHVRVLRPGDDSVSRRLEPESQGILRTMVRAHLWLGLAGAAVGVLAFGTMMVLGIPFIVLNPWWSGLLLTGFGALGGLIAGGAVSLRPDHTPYVTASREALREGKHVVVVHATSSGELSQAEAILKASGSESVRTL